MRRLFDEVANVRDGCRAGIALIIDGWKLLDARRAAKRPQAGSR